MNLRYGDKLYNDQQEKLANRVSESIKEGLLLDDNNSIHIMGLDIESIEQEYESTKEGKTPKELRVAQREIKNVKDFYGNFIKLEIQLNNEIKTCFTNDNTRTSKYFVSTYLWTGLLNFPIPGGFIFGRASRIKRYGGGKYFFTPLDLNTIPLMDLIQKLEQKSPELFPFDIIYSNFFIDLLKDIKFTKKIVNQMKTAFQSKSYSQQVNNSLVNKLNSDKKLISKLKKLRHFGNTMANIYKLVSDLDVSMIFFPYNDVTYFQIMYFGFFHKKSGSILKQFFDTLIS